MLTAACAQERLRAEGIKEIADFNRITDVGDLAVPAVTKSKLRDLKAALAPARTPSGAAALGAIADSAQKVQQGLTGLWGSVSAFLPTSSPAPRATAAASRAVKARGGIRKPAGPAAPSLGSRVLTPIKASVSALGAKVSSAALEVGGMLSPSRLAAPASPSSTRVPASAKTSSPTAARRQAAREATRAPASKGAVRAMPGVSKGKSKKEIKTEVVARMSLRAKKVKKGFYSIKHLEQLAWVKGAGTKKDPFVIS